MLDNYVDCDESDVEFVESRLIRNDRNGIIEESKLVQLIDALDLWCDGG